jgi:predicted short-subunit dehydrogenase-like oxidoreductase (DUF2520 family)
MTSQLEKIVVVGSGNIAHHFAGKFLSLGYHVSTIISRNRQSGIALAGKLGAVYLEDPSQAPADADLFLLAVSDSAIGPVAAALPVTDGIVAHTSGSVDIAALGNIRNRAVLYPLQAFSASREVDFSQVPLLVEAGNEKSLAAIRGLALSMSGKVFDATSEERRYLHMSAVFAANFTNALYAAAKELLEKNTSLSFDLLLPLVQETAGKIGSMNPVDAQTGPAKRNDEPVITKHLELLQQNPELHDIYTKLTALIKRQQHEKL